MSELRIVISADARTDLLELENYIAARDGTLRAELILGRIQGAIQTLAFMPGLGRARSYLKRANRAFPVPPWLVIYAPLPQLDGIQVVRVVDGRRDLPSVLGGQ